MQQQELSLVDKIMIEFGSLTCADVSIETVHITHSEDVINFSDFENMWKVFRRSEFMVEKFGPVSDPGPNLGKLHDWYRREMIPIFENFISRDNAPDQPYYLCICRENGDEYLVRRSLPNDEYTKGKFSILHCRFSEMPDCVPRNKLKATRCAGNIDGEYILTVIHVPGGIEDREKLKIMLDQYNRDGKFALM